MGMAVLCTLVLAVAFPALGSSVGESCFASECGEEPRVEAAKAPLPRKFKGSALVQLTSRAEAMKALVLDDEEEQKKLASGDGVDPMKGPAAADAEKAEETPEGRPVPSKMVLAEIEETKASRTSKGE
mmetsp:Transcript_738/g.1982  ORF Transcript_738/g.1982 Transcript_738/m.1982 type:complete len:128 (+) Transcript_738:78-461(+)